MSNRHPRLAGFDSPDGLHMNAQPSGRGGLTFAGLQPRGLRGGAELLDRLEGAGVDIGGDALALCHGRIVDRAASAGRPAL